MPESRGRAYAGKLLRGRFAARSGRGDLRRLVGPARTEGAGGPWILGPPSYLSGHPVTLIENAGSEAVVQPSLTVMTMPE